MLGIQSALMDVLLQGPRFKPADALKKGLVTRPPKRTWKKDAVPA